MWLEAKLVQVSRGTWRWLAVSVGLAGTAGAVVVVTEETHRWVSLVFLGLTVTFLAFALGRWLQTVDTSGTVTDQRVTNDLGSDASPGLFVLFAWLISASVFTALTSDSLINGNCSGRRVMLWWLTSLAFMLLFAWWQPLIRTVHRVLGETLAGIGLPPARRWLPWVGMIAIAAFPRFLQLNRYPTVIGGDEGYHMLTARASSAGTLPNPFGTGFFSTPNLYPVAQGWIADLIGPDLAGHRVLSATVGVIGVIATWRLGHYLVGPRPAAIGAILLATMPFHMFFSRTAFNNVTDPTVIVLAILLLIRATNSHPRGYAMTCGLVLGLGFHGYYGGRGIPIVIVALLVVMVITGKLRPAAAGRIGLWIATAFVITALPLLMVYRQDPTPLAGHLNQVSTLSIEGLRYDPATALSLFAANIWDAAMLPWIGNTYFFFSRDAPFFGWPIAILLAIGIAAWVARAIQQGDLFAIAYLVVPWAILASGIAFTTPVGGHRLLVLTPFWALAAGAGLFAVAGWLSSAVRPRTDLILNTMIVATVLAISLVSVRWWWSEERQQIYIDDRTILAWDLGWRVSQNSEESTVEQEVLFAGPPLVYSDGWGNLTFLAPNLELSDVEAPFVGIGSPRVLPEDMVLVLVAERNAERCAVEQTYPDATVAEIHGQGGQLLYTLFFQDPLTGWSTATTPAETTFTIVTDSQCPASDAAN